MLLLMGVFGTSGHLLFVQAAKLAPSSLIAPMQYVEIVCAAVFGYLVFGDFPSLVKWFGICDHRRLRRLRLLARKPGALIEAGERRLEERRAG